jgi:hypothetical protein
VNCKCVVQPRPSLNRLCKADINRFTQDFHSGTLGGQQCTRNRPPLLSFSDQWASDLISLFSSGIHQSGPYLGNVKVLMKLINYDKYTKK